jgi:hypothetical protein
VCQPRPLLLLVMLPLLLVLPLLSALLQLLLLLLSALLQLLLLLLAWPQQHAAADVLLFLQHFAPQHHRAFSSASSAPSAT